MLPAMTESQPSPVDTSLYRHPQGRSGPTREGIHARGVIDGQHCDARLLPQQINGASRKGLQLLSDLLLVEVVDSGAFSQQQPWRNANVIFKFKIMLTLVPYLAQALQLLLLDKSCLLTAYSNSTILGY